MKGIKKTFACEADQSRGELRKNYQKTLNCLFPMRRGKPVLHAMLALFKFMIAVSIYMLFNNPES